MKVPYFQRYHGKENVETNNAIMLLTRLYSYSPDKYYDFIESLVDSKIDNTLRPKAELQVKGPNSVPDAIMCQRSFKVIVETKLYGQFTIGQLGNHLSSFNNEDVKIFLTLDKEPMDTHILTQLSQLISSQNKSHTSFDDGYIHHAHLTFQEFAENIKGCVNSGDSEMIEVCDDYTDTCWASGLISNAYRNLMVVPVGNTFEANKDNRLYYSPENRSYRKHAYLGLYYQKAVQKIGKLKTTIVTKMDSGKLTYHDETTNADCNDQEIIDYINTAIAAALANPGYDLTSAPYRFFIVDKFYDTHFVKLSKGGLRSATYFDLTEDVSGNEIRDLFAADNYPSAAAIANILVDKEWE